MTPQERIQGLDRPSFRTFWDDTADAHRPAVLRARCRTDRDLFCTTFFPTVFNLPWCEVHREFLDRPKRGWRDRTRQVRRADLAPRGLSKTTLENFGDLIHDTVYGLEVCTLVYSTTYTDSFRMVKALYDVFTTREHAPLLHDVYGPFEVVGTQKEFAVFSPRGEPMGSQFSAKSFGGTGRGHLYRNQRPSKITMDDIVHPKHVYSPIQRDNDWRFLNNDVLKSGAPYTIFRMLNTVQHDDDTTRRAAKDPSWIVRQWSALKKWPANAALWAKCKAIWADLSNTRVDVVIVEDQPVPIPGRVVDAERFYRENRAEMDRGAEVLWEARRPLFVLMESWWANPASFWAEDQNDPKNPERQVFDVTKFHRFHFDGRTITMRDVKDDDGKILRPGRTVPLSDCDLARWLDPSLGKTASDYPALATLARERRTGYRFVLRCTLDKGPPSSQRARVWTEFDHEPRGKWGVDADGMGALFGEEFEREKQERQKTGRVWNLGIEGYHSSEDKHGRIARLESATANGFLQFADDLPQEVINQFRDEPHGSHDDAPDAIERADWLLTEGMMPVIEYGRR